MLSVKEREWADAVIKEDEITKYLVNGKDFIDEKFINAELASRRAPDKTKVRDILSKSLAIQRLEPAETAALLNVTDDELWQEMYAAALAVKKKVYDNRIVFFAPFYLSNTCVNNCAYCGFRADNQLNKRRVLSPEEIKKEVEVIAAEGHKRIIAVYGEHPASSADYIASSMEIIYGVNGDALSGKKRGNIRRINVNAAPMSVADLKKLLKAGLGTYQVFQETYDRERYSELHPATTIKGNYRWRLYALHRAMDAGIDDVALGALFGLADWRLEVMGLLAHAIDLERQFGIGPHTISFPRLKKAFGSDLANNSRWLVSDSELKKIITVLRLSIPYTGLIITARENPELRKALIRVGCTQTDASSRIGIGGYNEALEEWKKYTDDELAQDPQKQQFDLGDTRRLDTVIGELAEQRMISSFCTAGYRCGRTGDKIMRLLCTGVEGKYCKLNAVLTFMEYLNDHASARTKELGLALVEKELLEIKNDSWLKERKGLIKEFEEFLARIKKGERDLFI
jgi:2-iminoacetate synthase